MLTVFTVFALFFIGISGAALLTMAKDQDEIT